MKSISKLVALAIWGLILMVLCACGGLFDTDSLFANSSGDGLRFLTSNPTRVRAGATVRLLVEASSVSALEPNTTFELTASANRGATVSPALQSGRFGGGAALSVLLPIDVAIPSSAARGSEIVVTGERTAASGLGNRSATIRLRVDDVPTLSASINPASATGPVGGTASGTLTVTSQGGFAGPISLVGLLPDVVLEPTTLTLTAGGTATANVTYRIPSSAVAGTTTLVPVRAYNSSVTAFGTFAVTTTAPTTGSFDLSVSPASIFVQGGQLSSPVTVTLTPTAGFRGDIAVQLLLPGEGSLTVGGGLSNPLTVTVTDDNPVQRTIPLQYTPGTGVAPIGRATVRATATGVTRTATFNVNAS